MALNGRAGSHHICSLLKVDRPCRAAVTSHFDHKGHWPKSRNQAVSRDVEVRYLLELWMIELLSFCAATFRKSLAKVTRPAAAPPFRTSILKTACCTSRPVSLLDTTLWTSSPETCARHIHTPDWMLSLFAMARSLRSTSFSIPNLHSGRGTLA